MAHRLQDVVRVYLDENRRMGFATMMRTLASARIAYRLVPEDELIRVSGSRHHEGVCALVRPRGTPDPEAWVSECPSAVLALVLDGTRNPHNLGSIIRSAAHFGARGVWVVGPAPLFGAMARVAEGATESVDIFSVDSLTPTLSLLRRSGFQLVGASPDGDSSLFEHGFTRRTALILGSESEGLSEEGRKMVEVTLRISGTGQVQSLNTSVAAGILMAEYARQRSMKRRS